MASTLTVDTIVGATAANTVHVPGHVIQVVEGTTTTQTQHNSTSYAATEITASITPKFSNSKILVTITSNFETNSVGEFGWYSIHRGSTSIAQSSVGQPSGGGSPIFPIVIQKLDAPATTNAVTYALYIKRTNATVVSNINSGGINSLGVITLQEIAQ
jgi:hypothetical protein|tara:strand:+ start:13 stop:486 length:474 start_codon:yes stop_codon:yes gene_type:complete